MKSRLYFDLMGIFVGALESRNEVPFLFSLIKSSDLGSFFVLFYLVE